jgi:hypothetical protein
MVVEEDIGGRQNNDTWVPRPDPTALTTYIVNQAKTDLRREVAALRELLEARLKALEGVVGSVGATIEKMPNAAAHLAVQEQLDTQISALSDLFLANMDAVEMRSTSRRDDLQKEFILQVTALRELHEERFNAIRQQFEERDVRGEQDKKTSKEALDAALLAQKESVSQQNDANTTAATKSETSFALALDTPIFTADGWKTMGTVKAGDIAFAEDGEPTSVIATSGVFLDSLCYTVQFSDGSRIVATADHRWNVYDVRAWQGKWGVWKTLTTQEIVDSGWHRLRSGGNGYRYRVATNAVVQTPEAKLPIDPYIFGYWLGDGNSGGPTITVGNEDRDFVTAQIEEAGYRIAKEAEQVSNWGTSWALYFTNDERRGEGLYALLSQLGVRGPGRKHIPDLYLMASPDQRQALLAGLLDSDGTISKAASRVTFYSTSTLLAEGVRQLARSLGYRAVLHRYGDNYHVTWPPTENVFRNPRKVALFRPSTTRQREWASITDIQPTPTVPTRCLTVEHPSHVFLVGRGFIPTCNTKQIDQIGTLINTLEKSLTDRITELKERIDRGEGQTTGGAATRAGLFTFIYAAAATIAAVAAIIALAVH